MVEMCHKNKVPGSDGGGVCVWVRVGGGSGLSEVSIIQNVNTHQYTDANTGAYSNQLLIKRLLC